MLLLIFISCFFNFIYCENSNKNSKTTQVINFFAGGLAGTVSSTLTAPLEVIKTQLQSSSLGGKSNPIKVFKQIIDTNGPKGFYRGLKPMLIGIIPTRGIYFWAYSTSKHTLQPKIGNSPLNHLLSAFFAGITSNTVCNLSFFLHSMIL
jgi:hypothetical protein